VRIAIDCGPPILVIVISVATNPYQAIHGENELLTAVVVDVVVVAVADVARSAATLVVVLVMVL
jgi:hypothetical protein